MMETYRELVLNNNVKVASISLGTWKTPKDLTADVVKMAVEAGYRAIDTADAYRNEKEVGKGVRECGLPREEIYVTTKLWNKNQGRKETLQAFHNSLEVMDIDYIDQFLIHWPCPAYDQYVETYQAMEEILESGKVRTIGVCNFNIEHLERLLKECNIVPAVNQIEMHPMLIQPELIKYCQEHKIQIEAYSPLMHGGEILKNETMAKIASKYNKSTAQVSIRYLLQLGARVIVKSTHKHRMEENINVFDFTLSEEDMAVIETLNKGIRTCGDPATMNYRG
jgi:diketogulonate reductase-like aldo/keto reductase